MAQYIDKSALVAEIDKKLQDLIVCKKDAVYAEERVILRAKIDICKEILSFIDTLEVKEVEEKYEYPNIEAKDSVEVLSRMSHIDKRLLPIAEFIMDYCSWNLHKDEWNQPVLEVPLFRVLDALVQKGKPYCEG